MSGVLVALPGPKGPVAAIEYAVSAAPESPRPQSWVLLMPGTSIRPGPGADKSAKGRFHPDVEGIYPAIGRRLATEFGIPALQLCWRVFPADGGTTADAAHDILAAMAYAQETYGPQCGVLLVGYSFGGAALWGLLAQCFQRPDYMAQVLSPPPRGPKAAGAFKPTWLRGCLALSGALKGSGKDNVDLFGATRFLESCHAPLLILHGSDDDNVSVSAALKLYRLAPQLKSLCVLEGADHDLRDQRWVRLVTELCVAWLTSAGAPRGTGAAVKARSSLLAHNSGALGLCKVCEDGDRSRRDPGAGGSAAFAFEPSPRLETGGLAPYRSYEVPVLPESVLFTLVPGAERPPATGRGRRLPTLVAEEDAESSTAALAKRCSGHVERQQKARDRRKLERHGNLPMVLERFRASRAAAVATPDGPPPLPSGACGDAPGRASCRRQAGGSPMAMRHLDGLPGYGAPDALDKLVLRRVKA